MKLNRTPNPLDRNARNGENDNWDIIEGKTREISDKVNNFLNTLSEDAFNKVIEDIRLNWSHKVDNFSDLPSNPKKGDTVAVENDDMIYRYDGSNWIDVIPFTQFSAIAEIDNRLSSQLAETDLQLVNQAKRDVNLNAIKSNVPLVSFVDDDGNPAVLTKLLPLSQEYDIPFTVCMPSDFIKNGNGMSLEELKMLQNEYGFEIASHGKTHQVINNTMSKEQQFKEVYESWRVMREMGLNVETIVYPYGQSTPYAREVVSKYYKAGCATDTILNETPFRTYGLARFTFPTPGWTLNDYKNKVDEAISKNGWLIFMLHCGQAEHNAQVQQILEDLIVYIQSKNVDIVNITDGIDIAGNIIDINQQEFYWSRDGKNNIRDAEYNRLDSFTGNEKHTGATKPDEFPPRKMSIDPVATGNAQQTMPRPGRGTLITINNVIINNSQLFLTDDRIYYRSSNTDNTNWKNWQRCFVGIESEVSADFGSVGAGQRKEITVNVSGMVQGQHILVAPKSALLTDIEFNYVNAGAGNLRLVMINHKSGSVTIGKVNFNILRMQN